MSCHLLFELLLVFIGLGFMFESVERIRHIPAITTELLLGRRPTLSSIRKMPVPTPVSAWLTTQVSTFPCILLRQGLGGLIPPKKCLNDTHESHGHVPGVAQLQTEPLFLISSLRRLVIAFSVGPSGPANHPFPTSECSSGRRNTCSPAMPIDPSKVRDREIAYASIITTARIASGSPSAHWCIARLSEQGLDLHPRFIPRAL